VVIELQLLKEKESQKIKRNHNRIATNTVILCMKNTIAVKNCHAP
jgi:hypothetical protein